LKKLSQIGSFKYIIWFIVMILIFIVFGAVADILSSISLIGAIITILIISPYFYILASRSIALIYSDSDQMERTIE